MTGIAQKQAVCWVVSDGRRGIENQALGLAEALARQLPDSRLGIHTVHVTKQGFVALPSSPPPDVWIGCGRAAVPLVGKHRRVFPDCFFVYVQDPRTRYRDFDLIIAPDHDRVDKPNAIPMIGSPNRLSPAQLNNALSQFSDELSKLAGARAAVLIGGNSKRFQLDDHVADYLVHRLHTLLDQDIKLMITASRRTPEPVHARLKAEFGDRDDVWLFEGVGENPYFAFLAAADWVFVTEESTNMLVEAATTGKPVYALPMVGNPGKFGYLHAKLEGWGAVRPYLGQLDRWTYARFAETDRIATTLLDRWRKRASSSEQRTST